MVVAPKWFSSLRSNSALAVTVAGNRNRLTRNNPKIFDPLKFQDHIVIFVFNANEAILGVDLSEFSGVRNAEGQYLYSFIEGVFQSRRADFVKHEF